MTRITFFQEDGALRGFESCGHADYAEHGQDIVCAAVSAVLLTALNGLTSVLNLRCRVTRRDRQGYLKVMIPTSASGDSKQAASLVLTVAEAGLVRIAQDYPGHLSINLKQWG